MRLGIMAGYSGATVNLLMEMIKEADRMGVYAVWIAEAYGSDCVTPLAWIGTQTEKIKLDTAIMQITGRTPANIVMTVMTQKPLLYNRPIAAF